MQADGVHSMEIGEAATFRFDGARLYAFAADGALARAPQFRPSLPAEAQHGAHSAA